MGVTFGTTHSDDLGLFLTAYEIEAPEVQRYTVEVPGRNGVLDLTSALFGEAKFYNRKIEIELSAVYSPYSTAWPDILTAVLKSIHGQTLDVAFDDDPDWHWAGLCEVSPDADNDSFTITVDAEPFKYKTDATAVTVSLTADEEQTITLSNEYVAVAPTITVDGGDDVNVTIVCGTSSLVIGEGTYTSSLTLGAGETEWTISADEDCTVTISYQEGTL